MATEPLATVCFALGVFTQKQHAFDTDLSDVVREVLLSRAKALRKMFASHSDHWFELLQWREVQNLF
eukprot:9353107-Prorocentrum_lima.AAC.1